MPRIVFVLQVEDEPDRAAAQDLGKSLIAQAHWLKINPKSCFVVAPTDAPSNVGSISMDLRP